ncbi:soluble lytic murein transglycosylase-like protein [Thioflavicoccus mobilis 8321]|uniref:Soluble lytic murein transglycosylase-like protein n=2 Tax=Thioflavicoccus mobilis TaxID=80679 RepID=L0GZJ4_9GAMM|nr:soluble lytic murein transglycosylase-like protein [Thioflavicoccus mobilis 8321]
MVLAMLIAAVLPTAVGAGERLPTFDEIYRSQHAEELTAWGRRYERGVGVAQDTKKAVQLYCRAAAKGDRDAKYYMGQLLAFGRGIDHDKDLAAAWLHAAAEAGDRRSRNMLMVLNVGDKPTRRAVCPLGSGSVTRIASRSHPAQGAIADLVRRLAPSYGLDPELVLAVIETESNFNPNARSSKNAQGLMQLIPATAARFGVEDTWDPEQNLRGGMAYLSWLLKHFGGDVELALAGYNAGEGAVERHGGIPPYRETRNYVSRIVSRIN